MIPSADRYQRKVGNRHSNDIEDNKKQMIYSMIVIL